MGNSKVCQNLKSQAGQIARYFKNVKESVVNVCRTTSAPNSVLSYDVYKDLILDSYLSIPVLV